MWRTAASRVRFDLHDGLEVICRGYLDVYAPRGSYQLVIQQIEPKGLGALELALRRLREKLAAEGLFEPERKRPLPRFPRRIAFVTSPTGRGDSRFSGSAAPPLARRARADRAGARAGRRRRARRLPPASNWSIGWPQPVDVLVVGRGGGSLEDLWAFNEEVVVRAIHASRIPVVSAVGHEIDVTLVGPGGRRAGADAQRSGRAGRAAGRRAAGVPATGSGSD